MIKRENASNVVMGTLAVVMIMSLLLAVATFVLPQPAVAVECPYCTDSRICCQCWHGGSYCYGCWFHRTCYDVNCNYEYDFWYCS